MAATFSDHACWVTTDIAFIRYRSLLVSVPSRRKPDGQRKRASVTDLNSRFIDYAIAHCTAPHHRVLQSDSHDLHMRSFGLSPDKHVTACRRIYRQLLSVYAITWIAIGQAIRIHSAYTVAGRGSALILERPAFSKTTWTRTKITDHDDFYYKFNWELI